MVDRSGTRRISSMTDSPLSTTHESLWQGMPMHASVIPMPYVIAMDKKLLADTTLHLLTPALSDLHTVPGLPCSMRCDCAPHCTPHTFLEESFYGTTSTAGSWHLASRTFVPEASTRSVHDRGTQIKCLRGAAQTRAHESQAPRCAGTRSAMRARCLGDGPRPWLCMHVWGRACVESKSIKKMYAWTMYPCTPP